MFTGLDTATYNTARSNMIYWVLGTDMVLHKDHMLEFEKEL